MTDNLNRRGFQIAIDPRTTPVCSQAVGLTNRHVEFGAGLKL
jgi:hypothetical protein